MLPYKEKDFGEMIKDLKMRLSWISSWTLNLITSIFIKGGRGNFQNTRRAESDVRTKREEFEYAGLEY